MGGKQDKENYVMGQGGRESVTESIRCSEEGEGGRNNERWKESGDKRGMEEKEEAAKREPSEGAGPGGLLCVYPPLQQASEALPQEKTLKQGGCCSALIC